MNETLMRHRQQEATVRFILLISLRRQENSFEDKGHGVDMHINIKVQIGVEDLWSISGVNGLTNAKAAGMADRAPMNQTPTAVFLALPTVLHDWAFIG